jgi:hypothetical protein
MKFVPAEHGDQERPAAGVKPEARATRRPHMPIRCSPSQEELGQPAIALAPARQMELLAATSLLLDPRGAAPPLPIAGVQPLGHNSLQPEPSGRGNERLRLNKVVRRCAPGGRVEPELGEQLAPLLVWHLPHRVAVEMEAMNITGL